MSVQNLLRKNALETIKSMIDDKIISACDLRALVPKEEDPFDPEHVRQNMEKWYKTLGIEEVIRRKFSLSLPFFTRDEIVKADEANEILVCVPKEVTRSQLGNLFNLSSWALDDSLVSNTTEIEDFWFTTKRTLVPDCLDKSGNEIRRTYENESKLGMSLERYMVFVARMRYLGLGTPDLKHRSWLVRGKYEGKMMLVAGFDSNGKLSIHAWMPHLHSPLIGGRHITITDHL